MDGRKDYSLGIIENGQENGQQFEKSQRMDGRMDYNLGILKNDKRMDYNLGILENGWENALQSMDCREWTSEWTII